MYFRLGELWRVGYHDDPLNASIEYQGGGRYDDPQNERAVLYGGDSAETCIIEKASPWNLHVNASYVQRAEAPAADSDPELQEAELQQAERDREIAMQPQHMPQDLYDSAKAYVPLREPIVLLDLDEVAVRRDLAAVPEIGELLKANDIPDFDRSILLGRHLSITRAVSGFLMRNEFARHNFAGIRTLSRHQGEIYVLFEGRYRLGAPMVGPAILTREDPDVVSAAIKLRLVP